MPPTPTPVLPTPTPIPPTPTPTPTNTPVPPTATPTPTNTPLPPTSTPTATATSTPTNTPLPPTATPTATATNTPTPPTATPPAGGSFALDFDGIDDQLRADAVPGTGPLTIEAWVRPNSANGDGLVVVGSDDNSGWSLEINGGRPIFWLFTNQGWQFITDDQPLTPGQWVHLASKL